MKKVKFIVLDPLGDFVCDCDDEEMARLVVEPNGSIYKSTFIRRVDDKTGTIKTLIVEEPLD